MSRQSESLPESCEDVDVKRDTDADADADSDAAPATPAVDVVHVPLVIRGRRCNCCHHQNKRKKRRDLLMQQLKKLSAKRRNRPKAMYKDLLLLTQSKIVDAKPSPYNLQHSEFSTDNEFVNLRSRRKKKK